MSPRVVKAINFCFDCGIVFSCSEPHRFFGFGDRSYRYAAGNAPHLLSDAEVLPFAMQFRALIVDSAIDDLDFDAALTRVRDAI